MADNEKNVKSGGASEKKAEPETKKPAVDGADIKDGAVKTDKNNSLRGY